MARQVLCIRPEPGLSGTAERARALGLNIHAHPLFEIEPSEWVLPEVLNYDGLLIGSANVFRHGGDQIEALRHLPVFAVGDTTAQAAQEAGFTVAKVGRGGLQSVIDAAAAKPMRYLRPGGEERVSLEAPSWQSVTEITVYRSRALPMDAEAAALLADGPIVMLHSAAAARHFTNECKRLGADLRTITLAALGPRIADAAGGGWQQVAIAPAPDDGALLAMIRNICQ